jgi:RNA polymerase sigma-70 factor (ECF subfamily)
MEQLAALATDEKIFHYAYSLTRDVYWAEDVMQNAFLQAATKLHQFQPGTNLRDWFIAIIRTTFINEYNKKQKGLTTISLDTALSAKSIYEEGSTFDFFITIKDIVDHVAAVSNKDYCDKMLETLRQVDRELVKMLAEGYTYKEISVKLDIPIGTVMSRTYGIRRKLREWRKKTYLT